jgi:hypothetical protein
MGATPLLLKHREPVWLGKSVKSRPWHADKNVKERVCHSQGKRCFLVGR